MTKQKNCIILIIWKIVISIPLWLHIPQIQDHGNQLWKYFNHNGHDKLTMHVAQYIHLNPSPVVQTSASTLFYKHPCLTCQKISQAHQWPCSLRIKAKFSCKVYIHESMHVKLGGNQPCSSVLSSGCPRIWCRN